MKRKAALWVAVAILGLAAAWVTWTFSESDQPTAPKSRRVVKVAVDPQLGSDGRIGYGAKDNPAAGYLSQISKETGLVFRYVKTSSHEDSLRRLLAGQVDIVPTVLGIPQPVAADRIQYSTPYYKGATLVFTRTRSDVEGTLASLAGKTVAFKRGGEYEHWLQQNHPEIRRLALPDVPDVLAAVESGMADAGIGVDAVYSPLLSRDHRHSLHASGTVPELPVEVRVIVRRGDAALLADINEALESLSSDQHMLIFSRWLDAVYRPTPTLKAFVRHYAGEFILGLITLLALVFALYQAVRMHRLAKAGEREKARLLAVMSHEIRNSANSLVAAVELMANGNTLPEQRSLLNAAQASGASLRMLLDNALEYTRLEAGRFTPHLTRCDVVAIARECRSAFLPMAEEKSLQCHLHMPHGALPWLWLDAVCVRQLMTNLLSNAIKFTERGEIVVSVWFVEKDAEHGQLFIAVKDTGVGMSKAVQSSLFEPFTHPPESRPQGGAGLGLSICWDITCRLGGHLRVESESGVGSSFEVELPARTVSPEVPQERVLKPAIATRSWNTANTSVLVVEDHSFSRRTLTGQLETLGLRVHAAADGAAALATMHESGPFRAGFLDCNLPDMDGYDVARALRSIEAAQHWPPMQLVAISALSGEEHKQRCAAAGIDDVLCKPISQAQIAESLGESAQETEDLALRKLFFDGLQEDLASIDEAIASSDWKAAIHYAHRIYGGALMAEEREIALLGKELEELLRAYPSADVDVLNRIQALVAQLRKYGVGGVAPTYRGGRTSEP